MAGSGRRVFRFGLFEADMGTGELRKAGVRLRLQEQPFQVLALFLERPGEVISREEIQKKLWPSGTFVDFDHSLNTAINKIREVLGDSASNPQFVETLAKRGYRFIAPVSSGTAVAAEKQETLASSSAMGELFRLGFPAHAGRRSAGCAAGLHSHAVPFDPNYVPGFLHCYVGATARGGRCVGTFIGSASRAARFGGSICQHWHPAALIYDFRNCV
jgi:DNA-binding winged helix-turn-helix (wHTH) protein